MSELSVSVENSFTQTQKAAIVLLSLGPASSGELLKKMSEDSVEAISSAMAKLEPPTQEQIESVLIEFETTVRSRNIHVKGGLEHVRTILMEAFGREQATRMMDRVSKTLDQDAVDFSSLRKVDSQQLAKFIQDEHPQTVALVLSHLDPTKAAALICALPVEMRLDVVTRMAGLEQISPESVRTIAAVVGKKLRNLGELSREACGGVRAVADMFNRLDPINCGQILDALENEDPALFENVRRLMFVFEDLAGLDALGIKELTAHLDRKLFMIALKGSSEELRTHFMGGMSQRGADIFKEDMAALGPIKIKEIDAAQQEILKQAREMEKDGKISLKNSPAEEYVK